MRYLVAGLLGLAACAGAGGAPRASGTSVASRPAASAPRVRPALAPLAYFVGAWTAEARDPGTGKRFTLRYRVTPGLEGAWLDGVGHASELGLHIHDRWGIDGPTGDIIRVVFDSTGVWAVVRARDWTGDVLVLTGEAHTPDGIVQIRETIRRDGPDAFGAVWEAEQAGVWTPYSIERLTRDR